MTDSAAELARLLARAESGELTPDESVRLSQLVCADSEALDDVVTQLETEALLQWHHGRVEPSRPLPSRMSAAPVGSATSTRRTPTLAIVVSMAALVMVGIGLHMATDSLQSDAIPIADGGRSGTQPPAPSAVVLENWSIEPIGHADFSVEDGRVVLRRGELQVTRTSPPADDRLRIETPCGNVEAAEAAFLVGTHVFNEGRTMRQLTRALVLTGLVTLVNTHGRVSGDEHVLLTADDEKAPIRHVVEANSDFAFNLYRQLSQENAGQNVFFSPYSVSSALAMVGEGARGETALEMGRVLRYPEAARLVGDDAQLIPWRTALINSGFSQLNARLNADRDEDPRTKALRAEVKDLEGKLSAINLLVSVTFSQAAYQKGRELADRINELNAQIDNCELEVANAVWTDQQYKFRDDYLAALERYYGTGAAHLCDFANDKVGAAQRINGWIRNKTRGRIPAMVDPDAIPPRLRMMLTNAVYFKGSWADPFKASRTKPRDFHLADGTTFKTPIMYAWEKRRFAAFNGDGSFFDTPKRVPSDNRRTGAVATEPDADGFKVVELPYSGGRMSMVLIAPQSPGGLNIVEDQLTSSGLARWLEQLDARSTRVYLPRFRMETNYRLGSPDSGALVDMGMGSAFTPRADFSGMSDSGELMITSVLHRAFVEVNEQGTEAAAVTIAAAADSAAAARTMVPYYPTFNADRPFLFLIRDIETGTVLFVGRVQRPVTKS